MQTTIEQAGKLFSNIVFRNRNRAKLLRPPIDEQVTHILSQLELPQVGAVFVISGTAVDLDKRQRSRLQQLFSRGIARVALAKEAIIIDRGTSNSIVELIGQGIADRGRKTPLLGVAPIAQVATTQGGSATKQAGQELDPNHSHFVLVDSDNWDDASALLVEIGSAVSCGLLEQPPKSTHPTPPTVSSPSSEPPDLDSKEPSNSGQSLEEQSAPFREATEETLDEDEPNSPSAVTEESGTDEVDRTSNDTHGPTSNTSLISFPGSSRLPVIAILAGGEVDTPETDPSKKEILQCVRQGWPVIILRGTGGLADELFKLHCERNAALRQAEQDNDLNEDQEIPSSQSKFIEDPDVAEIIIDGDLIFFEPDGEPEDLIRVITNKFPLPWASNLLHQAWQRFATFDYNAERHQDEHRNYTVRLLWLGFLTTLVAILITWLNLPETPNVSESAHRILRWTIIALPIFTSVGFAIYNRRKASSKWLLFRGSAEELKSSIYIYRVLGQFEPKRQLAQLEMSIEDISRRLMQSDANEAALIAYDGPIPPKKWGAVADDDGLCPLSPERYIEIRIGDQISFYEGRTKQKEYYLRFLQFLFLAIGGLSTFLAAIGQEIWVPLTTAAVTGLTTYLLSEQYQETIITYNQGKTDMLNIRLWWDALPEIEQQRLQTIQKLVFTTENALSREIRGWIQNMQNALTQLREEMNDLEQDN